MTNPGAYPIDPETRVGLLRALVGDTAATTHASLPDGERSYAVWSDLSLRAALIIAGYNLHRAAADLYAALAAAYDQQGQTSARADDLNLTIQNRGSNLLAIANSFRVEGAAAAAAEADEIFIVAPLHCAPHRRGGFL